MNPVLLMLACVTLLAACSGGPRLAGEVPAGVDLSGAWRLDREASQDPQVLIAEMQDKMMKRMRRSPEPETDVPESGTMTRGPGGGTGEVSAQRAMERQAMLAPRIRERGGFLRARYGDALGARLSGDGLVIEQSPSRFLIVRGTSRRTYTPGGHSVVSVADGVADQSSGWKGREFVIDVRPQVGPHLTERYGLSADGRLVEKVSLEEDGLPTLEFTRVYEPGAAPPRELPSSN
jgi:hypothetical protein